MKILDKFLIDTGLSDFSLRPYSVINTNKWLKESEELCESVYDARDIRRTREEVLNHCKVGLHAEHAILEQIEDAKKVDYTLGYDLNINGARIEIKNVRAISQVKNTISAFTLNFDSDKFDYLLLTRTIIKSKDRYICEPLALTYPKFFMKTQKFGKFNSNYESENWHCFL